MHAATGQTHGLQGVAVQIDDPIFRYATSFMQAVHILCNEPEEFALIIESPEKEMAGVGPGPANTWPRIAFTLPVEQPLAFIAQKLFEIDRLVAVPQATLAAVVRNSGFGAYSGAGKSHDLCALLQRSSQSFRRCLRGLLPAF